MTALLIAAAVASGTLLTWRLHPDWPLAVRVAAGAVLGVALQGVAGVAGAHIFGFERGALPCAWAASCAPLAMLAQRSFRQRVGATLATTWRRLTTHAEWTRDRRRDAAAWLLGTAALLAVCDRAVLVSPDGSVGTGVEHNLGDLPFHLAVTSGFAWGANVPPQHPELAGVRLTYPYLTDFVAALWTRSGTALPQAFRLQHALLAPALVVLLWQWGLALTRDRRAARLVPLLVLASGGLGFLWFAADWRVSGTGLLEFLMRLPHDYTIQPEGPLRWGNSVLTLLIPQRGFLLALPLVLIVWSLWAEALALTATNERRHRATEDTEITERTQGLARSLRGPGDPLIPGTGERAGVRGASGAANAPHPLHAAQGEESTSPRDSTAHLFDPRGSVAAELRGSASAAPRDGAALLLGSGCVAGLLPLAHGHSFASVMALGAALALLFPRRAWGAFFAVSLALGVPQALLLAHGSALRTSAFLALHVGWDHGAWNPLVFWLLNTGAFLPLLALALLLAPSHLRRFHAPFALLFVVPNLLRLSPWVWDNVKFLFLWFVASAPLVAVLVARLAHGRWLRHWAAAAVVIVLTLSGTLDLWRVGSRQIALRLFDADGLAFALRVAEVTPPHARLLHWPTHDAPTLLSGRPAVLGYPGHIWSQGLDAGTRESDIATFYTAAPGASDVLRRYDVDFVVLGPQERPHIGVGLGTLLRVPVAVAGPYQLYGVRPR